MAYDKILTLHGKVDNCLEYVLNEEKTSLETAIEYIENPAKTRKLVTGINCEPDAAIKEMTATKRRWDKRGGVAGYHIIHSYAPGEVTPEEAHTAGVEFARRLLGDRYEAVISTHVDREHLHCHIVFNSVSFVDGKKYRSDFKSYFHDLRDISNEVSRERGLSVIEPENGGKHYAEWQAERSGKTTVRDLVRQDIDAAIRESFTYNTFLAALRKQGYTIKYGPNVKYTAIRPPGGERFFRLKGLGKGYTENDIRARLAAIHGGETPSEAPSTIELPRAHKRYTVTSGTIPRRPRRRLRGFRALYVRYLYLLGGTRRRKRYNPSFAVRKEVTKLERYQRQYQFLSKNRIETDNELNMLYDAIQAKIDALTDERKWLYGMRREGYNVDARIGGITTELRELRRQLKTCNQITEDIPRIRSQTELVRLNEQEQEKKRTEEKHRKEHRGKWM